MAAGESVMVGDSMRHDIDGARQIGMRAVLVRRAGPDSSPLQKSLADGYDDVPVITSLHELPALLLPSSPVALAPPKPARSPSGEGG